MLNFKHNLWLRLTTRTLKQPNETIFWRSIPLCFLRHTGFRCPWKEPAENGCAAARRGNNDCTNWEVAWSPTAKLNWRSSMPSNFFSTTTICAPSYAPNHRMNRSTYRFVPKEPCRSVLSEEWKQKLPPGDNGCSSAVVKKTIREKRVGNRERGCKDWRLKEKGMMGKP